VATTPTECSPALRRQTPDRLPFFIRLSPPVIEEMKTHSGETGRCRLLSNRHPRHRHGLTHQAADYQPYLAGKPLGSDGERGRALQKTRGTFQHLPAHRTLAGWHH